MNRIIKETTHSFGVGGLITALVVHRLNYFDESLIYGLYIASCFLIIVAVALIYNDARKVRGESFWYGASAIILDAAVAFFMSSLTSYGTPDFNLYFVMGSYLLSFYTCIRLPERYN